MIKRIVTWGIIGTALSGSLVEADLVDLRVWPHDRDTRVVLEASVPLSGQIFHLTEPDRIVLDVTSLETAIDSRWASTPLHGAPIDQIRIGHHGETSRVVIPLLAPHQFTSFVLPPDNDRGYRWVVDLRPSEHVGPDKRNSQAGAEVHSTPPPASMPPRVVVIDPGHGGHDPGAIGPGGTYEKDVVLAISKAIKGRLDREPHLEAILTRTDDTYIGLRDRVRLARRLDASLFISIHADAAPRRSAQGGSVYALSPGGASSEMARWLVANEAHAIADTDEDVAFLSHTQDDSARYTLLDLSIGRSIQQSIETGELVLAALGEVGPLHKRYVERANFAVLRSPDIPSLLVETGFISNPEEEARLKDPHYQARIGKQIANAVIAALDTAQ